MELKPPPPVSLHGHRSPILIQTTLYRSQMICAFQRLLRTPVGDLKSPNYNTTFLTRGFTHTWTHRELYNSPNLQFSSSNFCIGILQSRKRCNFANHQNWMKSKSWIGLSIIASGFGSPWSASRQNATESTTENIQLKIEEHFIFELSIDTHCKHRNTLNTCTLQTQ